MVIEFGDCLVVIFDFEMSFNMLVFNWFDVVIGIEFCFKKIFVL